MHGKYRKFIFVMFFFVYYRTLFFSLSNNVTVISISKFDPIHTKNHAIIVYSVVFCLCVCVCMHVRVCTMWTEWTEIMCGVTKEEKKKLLSEQRRMFMEFMEFKCMHTYLYAVSKCGGCVNLIVGNCVCVHLVVACWKPNDTNKN